MTAPSTFSGLKTSVANWLNRDDLSTTEIPEAIGLAEKRFDRLVQAPEREATTTLTATTNSVALPADFWGVKAVYVDADTDQVLTRLTVSDMRDTYPDATTGTPTHYAIEGETMLIGPTPSASTSVKLTYIQSITPLSDAAPSNWLLTDHPDLYLWGTLSELCALLRDNEGFSLFEAKMRVALEDINRSSRARSINSGPLTANHSTRHVRNIQA